MLTLVNLAEARNFSERRDCPILYDLGKWEHEYIKGGGEYWGRRQAWIEGRWETNTSDGLYLDDKHKSYSIQKDQHNSAALVYIGSWQKVSLIRRNGLLAHLLYENADWRNGVFNTSQEEVEIRMIASQKGKYLENHYEIKDELNSKIPEQKFILLEEPDDLIVMCDILRAQKFGYNAVSDYKLNPFRFFTGKVLVGSGKIIDSETGEIIADEKGNLIKTDISE